MRCFLLLLVLASVGSLNIKGQSWQRVQLIPDTAYSPDMWGGKLLGDTAIIMGGYGYLFYSTDYLRTYFVDSSFKGQVLDVMAFGNRDTGYITADHLPGGFLRTINGGRNWYPLPYGPASGAQWGNRIALGTNNIAYGADTYSDFNSIDRIDISVPTARTFTISLPVCTQIVQLRITNDSTVYVLCSDGLSPYDAGILSVVCSTDSGKTWRYRGYPAVGSNGDMWLTDDTTVIIVGEQRIAKSINGGDSFNIVMQSADLNDAIPNYKNAIYFVNHDTGFVAFAFDVHKTYDAGDTWIKTDFAFDSTDLGNHINFITATSSQKIIVGCANGNIYKTENGGGIYTGVNDVKPQLSFNLYPNPTNNKLEIELQNVVSNSLLISIMDISGQVLSKQKISLNGKTEIDISDLPAGLYFLKVQNDSQSWTKKFIRN